MEDQLTPQPATEQSRPRPARFTAKQKKMMVLAAMIVIPLALAFYFKSHFIAATVDGSPISRLTVIRELERQGGETVLNALITDKLVDAEAARKGIVLSDEELNEEIDKLKKGVTDMGGSFEEALAERGFTEESLRRNIATQLKIRKLLADVISVTEEEIDSYITESGIEIPAGNEAELREQVRTELEDGKFTQEAEGFIEGLKAQADITYYVNY
jgi:foldase protein PrsA